MAPTLQTALHKGVGRRLRVDELAERAFEPGKAGIHVLEARIHFRFELPEAHIDSLEARIDLRVEPFVRELGIHPLFDERRVDLIESLVNGAGQMVHLLLDGLHPPGEVVNPVSHHRLFPRVYHRLLCFAPPGAKQQVYLVARRKTLRTK